MAISINDTNKVFAPKPIDDRHGKFVSGVWQPFDSVADANTRVTYRYKTLTVPILIGGDTVEYWYKNGITDNDLIPKGTRAFASFAGLSGTSDRYETGATIATKGFYTDGDGGAGLYLVSSAPLSGIATGSPAQVSIPGGKYAILTHQGSVNMEQFGAKGDGITNDYMALFYINNFKKIQSNLNTIYGTPNKSYLLRKSPRAISNAGQNSFETDCYIRVNYSGCTWDGRGAKFLWDNNFNQSRVYYTKSGHTNVYRAKLSSVGQEPQVSTMAENSWWDYYWQVMEQDVTPNGTYPTWNNSTQYYGAETFCHIGYYPSSGQPKVENVTFKNWDISGMESDSVAANGGMWNIFAKGFYIFYGYNNITYDTINLHHIVSEMFYGGAESENGRQTIKGCHIYKGHNGISGGGYPFYIQDNIFEDLSANGIENFPFDGKLVITGNTFRRCNNGATIGGPGNDLQVQGHVTLGDNTFDDVLTYGIYFSGRARGVTVRDNVMYDAGISFYMLSNLGFPMTASEYLITNNHIYAHKKQLNFGIIMNSAAGDVGDYTSNIVIQNNIIGTTTLKTYLGYEGQMGTAISFYGELYKDVIISGNSYVGKVSQFYEYVVKTNSWSPIFGKNFYRTEYYDNHIIGIGFGTAYNTPTTFDTRYVKGDNQMIQLGGAPPYNGWGTAFFIAPNLHTLSNRIDNLESYIGCFHATRAVLLPSGNDNLKRAFIYQALNGCGGTNKTGVSLKLIQANTCFERDSENWMRSWEYQGLTSKIEVPNVVPIVNPDLFGNIVAGESKYYDIYCVNYNFSYDQWAIDHDVSNNILTVAGITITSLQVEYSGNYFLRITFQNTSGSTISMDGKVVAYKIYPVSNPTHLPTNIAPLRDEGLTNMIPTGDDIPHKFLFRDMQANKYLEYNKKTLSWVEI